MAPDSPPAAVPEPDISAPVPPKSARPCGAVSGVRQNVAGRLRRRIGLGTVRHRRPAALDDGGAIQRDLCALSFPAGTEHRQLSVVFGSRFGAIVGGLAAFAGAFWVSLALSDENR